MIDCISCTHENPPIGWQWSLIQWDTLTKGSHICKKRERSLGPCWKAGLSDEHCFLARATEHMEKRTLAVRQQTQICEPEKLIPQHRVVIYRGRNPSSEEKLPRGGAAEIKHSVPIDCTVFCACPPSHPLCSVNYQVHRQVHCQVWVPAWTSPNLLANTS